jgi:DNA-binding MarR family transcriptional regulator
MADDLPHDMIFRSLVIKDLRAARAMMISPECIAAYRELQRAGSLTSAELATFANISTAAAAVNLKRLYEAGYVTRKQIKRWEGALSMTGYVYRDALPKGLQ